MGGLKLFLVEGIIVDAQDRSKRVHEYTRAANRKAALNNVAYRVGGRNGKPKNLFRDVTVSEQVS